MIRTAVTSLIARIPSPNMVREKCSRGFRETAPEPLAIIAGLSAPRKRFALAGAAVAGHRVGDGNSTKEVHSYVEK